jgi:putative membrane protein (TIGR04086 family)
MPLKRSGKVKPVLLFLEMFKVILFSCILSAGMILLLALALKWGWIGVEGVDAMNTVIKALSAAIAGVAISGRQLPKSWLVAGSCGVLYMMASFALFALLGGGFHFGTGTLSDLLMVFACASCACILSNIIREKKTEKAAS